MTLEDFNDNAPVFKPSNVYHANISEGQDIDSEALRVETFDPDKNQIVTYQIQNAETSAFRINPNTGRIILLVCLFDCLFILFYFFFCFFFLFIFLFIFFFLLLLFFFVFFCLCVCVCVCMYVLNTFLSIGILAVSH